MMRYRFFITLISIVLLSSLEICAQTDRAKIQAEKDAAYKEYKSKGDEAFGKSNHADARDAYQIALQNKPGDRYLSDKIAVCNIALEKKYKEAIQAGDTKLKSGALAAAKEDYAQALRAKPTDAYALEQLAKCDPESGSSFNKTYGTGKLSEARCVVAAKDGGYVAAGRTLDKSGNIDTNFLRFDENGALIWEQKHGENEADEIYDIINTSDGGFLAVGYSDSYGEGEGLKQVLVIKISSNGAKEWHKTFGAAETVSEGRSIVEAHDGGYVLIGNTLSLTNPTATNDIYMLKISPKGDLIWEKKFGGDNNEEGNAIVQSEDGYTIVGNTESFGKGKFDAWMVHTDKNGSKLWDVTFGGSDTEMANSVILTKDGGYLIAGYTYTFANGAHDAWIVKTDAKGKEMWSKVFGGLGEDEAFDIVETKDGNYLLGGYTDVYTANKQGENTSSEKFNVFIVKFNRQGNKLWERSIGGLRDQRAFDVIEANDGGVLTVGHSQMNEKNDISILIVKTTSAGNVR